MLAGDGAVGRLDLVLMVCTAFAQSVAKSEEFFFILMLFSFVVLF
jgi:hypothetical protein